MTRNARVSLAKKVAVGLLSFVTVAAVAFAFFGRGPEAGSITPGKGGSSKTDSSEQSGRSNDTPGSASSANDDVEPSRAPSKTTASSVRSTIPSPTNRPAAGSSGGSGIPLVDDATEVVEGVADQLGETVDGVTDALDDAGTDLETVTEDVLELVEDGVPLEEAVDTVLDLLPLPSLPPIVPIPLP